MSVATFMQGVLDCTEAALNAAGRPVGLASLTPGGPPAWDNCCADGGQLYVRLVQMYPTLGPDAPFPQVDVQQKGCHIAGVAARIAVGVLRCVHTIDDGMKFPTGAVLTQDATQGTDDAETILTALLCCAVDLPGIFEKAFKLDTWTPLGPLGGCAGGEWQFIAAFDVCACPEPEPSP